jgi:hypothetical protein
MIEIINQFQPGADEAYEDFERFTKESIARRESVGSSCHSAGQHLIAGNSITNYVHVGLLVYLIKCKLSGITDLEML